MPGCAVYGCANHTTYTRGFDIRYYTFPKNEEIAKQWLFACRRNDNVNLKTATICSIHFTEDCYEIPLMNRMLNHIPKNKSFLKGDAIPTENLSVECAPNDVKVKRKRKNYGEKLELMQQQNNNNNNSENLQDMPSDEAIIETLNNINSFDIDEMCAVRIENFYLQEEVSELKEKVAALESANNELTAKCEKLTMKNNMFLLQMANAKNNSAEEIPNQFIYTWENG